MIQHRLFLPFLSQLVDQCHKIDKVEERLIELITSSLRLVHHSILYGPTFSASSFASSADVPNLMLLPKIIE